MDSLWTTNYLFQCIQTGVVPEDVWRAAPQPFLPTQFLNDFIYPGFVSVDGTSPSVTCDSDMASPLDFLGTDVGRVVT